jgi:hypothetical protein
MTLSNRHGTLSNDLCVAYRLGAFRGHTMTYWSDRLRGELCNRAASYAATSQVTSYPSLGADPVTLFPAGEGESTHGNFHPESYAAILANPEWRARLAKSHSRRKRALPAPFDQTAKELDSCTSSDALLMNICCYPNVVAGGIAQIMGVAPGSVPAFGVRGAVRLTNGHEDSTEVDLRLGDTNVEAKLTETSFTTGVPATVQRYADLEAAFKVDRLPRKGEDFLSYQLIRNVLAIHPRSSARFVVVMDARRPDLLREWWNIHTAIREGSLRARCGVVTWQELAALCPEALRAFLVIKYGL